MAEERKEQWTTYLAISTVIIAVCATLSTFKGGGFSTKSLMSQSKASAEWAHYQSKSIKGYLFEMEKDQLGIQLQSLPKTKEAASLVVLFKSKLEGYDQKIQQYEKDKTEISDNAKKFEAERDLFKKHSSAYGVAVIFLQVSILLSSIAALMKKKFVWYFSMAVGLTGIFFFINGFFLLL